MITPPSISHTEVLSGQNSFYVYTVLQPPPPPPPSTNNLWDKIRFLKVHRNLFRLYKFPWKFQMSAAAREDRVTPVSVPPADGHPG